MASQTEVLPDDTLGCHLAKLLSQNVVVAL